MAWEQQRAAGRLGGPATASRHDPMVYTAAARRTFLDSFLDAIPTDLPAKERERRAKAALRLHMRRLAHRRIQKMQARAARAKEKTIN